MSRDEFDADGQKVAQWDMQGASNGCRLANGNTLMTVGDSNKCLELDPKGTLVKETTLPAATYRIKRR